jgi:hypothetical protein
MKRFLMLVAVLVPLTAAGCGQPQVVAEAALTDETGERVALGDLPIRLLPYDRDAVFDSLEQAFATPEPPIPAEIIARQQEVQTAQTTWSSAEERWATVRDSLRTLSTQLGGMSRQSPQYVQLYARFNTLEDEERRLNSVREQAFERFDQLQRSVLSAADSVRVQRDLWAEEAFADFETVVTTKLRESGREEFADTTNAQGFATFSVPEGQWWVYGRYTLPYEELYWNIPVEVAGDSTHVTLNRENAEVRPVL